MMKRNILTLLVLVALLMPAALRAAGPSASSILAKMRKSMLAKPAVEAQFTINGADGAVQGSALMAGAAFAFTTPQLDVWFDGRTQWVFLHSTGEVSITEPTPDELATTNPFVVLSAYDTHYTSRRLPDSSGRRRVELVPRDADSGIRSITVIADTPGNWPQAIIVDLDSGERIHMVIDRIAGRAKPADTAFRYDARLHPASEIIDLR